MNVLWDLFKQKQYTGLDAALYYCSIFNFLKISDHVLDKKKK